MESSGAQPPPPTAVESSAGVVDGDEFDESYTEGDTKTTVADTGATVPDVKPHNENSCLKWTKIVFHAFMNVLSFRFPIQQPPITFVRPHDHTRTGKRDSTSGDVNRLNEELTSEVLEVKVNFRPEFFERYREVIEERLEAKAMNNPKRIDDLKLDEFPGWSRAVFLRLRSLFHIFDRGGDGLVDFTEFEGTLDEYGDETSQDERRLHFQAADSESIGSIDFEQFLKMMYNLTMGGGPQADKQRVAFSSGKKNKDVFAESGHSNPTSDTDGSEELTLTSLGTSLRQIDRNMSRIKSLDVVQQLQAGLF